MADNLLTPINKIINDTTSTIVDSHLTKSVADVVKSAIDSSVKAIDNLLDKIKELTKEEE